MKIEEGEDTMTGWEKQKVILKEKFRSLTDDDLDFPENRRNEMLGKLALKLAMTTREIRKVINNGQ